MSGVKTLTILCLLIQGFVSDDDELSVVGGGLDLGDTFGDMSNSVGDAFGDVSDGLGNIVSDVGDMFSEFDFSSFAEEQIDAFKDALSSAGDFTSEQIEEIRAALEDEGESGLESLSGYTDEQFSAIKSALESAEDSGAGRVVVGAAVFSLVVMGGVLM